MLATINGKQIFYEVYGSGEPLIFLHGLGVSHQMWKWQIDELQKDFQVIVYDLPGHGESEFKLPTKDVYLGLAKDLNGLMEHLGIEKAAICGLSLGGRLGLAMAVHYPERVSRLIVSSTFEKLHGFGEKFNTWLGTRMLKKMPLQQIAEVSAMNFFPAPANSEAKEIYIRESLRANKDAIIHLSHAAGETDYSKGIKAIKVPTLVLVGEKEVLMTKIAQRIAAAIPGAKLEVIPLVGHVWNMEKPEVFNAKVREFLRSNA